MYVHICIFSSRKHFQVICNAQVRIPYGFENTRIRKKCIALCGTEILRGLHTGIYQIYLAILIPNTIGKVFGKEYLSIRRAEIRTKKANGMKVTIILFRQ